MSETTAIYTEQQLESEALAMLVAALRTAQAQVPYAAQHLALAAFVAVYGLGGVSDVSKALRSS